MSQPIIPTTASWPCLPWLPSHKLHFSTSQIWLQDVPQHSIQADATDGPELAREKSLCLTSLIWSPGIRWRMLMECLLYICLVTLTLKRNLTMPLQRSSVASHPYNPHASIVCTSQPCRLLCSTVTQWPYPPARHPPSPCLCKPASLAWGNLLLSKLEQWFSNVHRPQELVKTQIVRLP